MCAIATYWLTIIMIVGSIWVSQRWSLPLNAQITIMIIILFGVQFQLYTSYRMCAMRRKGQPASMLSGQLTNVVRHTMTSSMLFCPSNRVYMFTFGKTVRTGQWAVINAYARAHAHTHATWWPMTVSLKGVRILNGLWKWDAYIIQIMILKIYELWSKMSACVSTTSLVFKSKHKAFGLGQKSNNFNADLWISME